MLPNPGLCLHIRTQHEGNSGCVLTGDPCRGQVIHITDTGEIPPLLALVPRDTAIGFSRCRFWRKQGKQASVEMAPFYCGIL